MSWLDWVGIFTVSMFIADIFAIGVFKGLQKISKNTKKD